MSKDLSTDELPQTKANAALRPEITPEDAFCSPMLQRRAYWADRETIILNCDVSEGLQHLISANIQVDCIVTSPPFYGQRDYDVVGQVGLEEHPSQYIDLLLKTFDLCKQVLKNTGSLWVNIGDTFWSGKGQHRSDEKKQSARRFGMRPQDKKGDGNWCRPKQLLLVPHRFAIGMQDRGWLVRNDNIWVKPNPIPDQVRDRCSISHEYVFHFVKERWYYFNRDSVGRQIRSTILPPLDTWQIKTSRGTDSHKATFSEELVKIPILATTPVNGVVLDPFAGSGTSLIFARKSKFRCIGIDLKKEFCETMKSKIKHLEKSKSKDKK